MTEIQSGQAKESAVKYISQRTQQNDAIEF